MKPHEILSPSDFAVVERPALSVEWASLSVSHNFGPVEGVFTTQTLW